MICGRNNLIRILIGLSVLIVVIHLLVLLKIIPVNIVWGGRVKSGKEMYVFESISIVMNLLLIGALSLRCKNVRHKLIDVTLWTFFVIFSLNTIGNLLAQTYAEKYFAIVSLIFALLLFIILKKKDKHAKMRMTNDEIDE